MGERGQAGPVARAPDGQPALPVGPIDQHHHRYGGKNGMLGAPVGEEEALGDGAGGRRRDFRGVLYGTQHRVSVRIPHTDQVSSCHRPGAGVRTPIESSVYWSPKTGAHMVQGDIRRLWLEKGGHEGVLGYPISDEMDTTDGRGRRSLFEHGEIHWSSESGATMRRATRTGG